MRQVILSGSEGVSEQEYLKVCDLIAAERLANKRAGRYHNFNECPPMRHHGPLPIKKIGPVDHRGSVTCPFRGRIRVSLNML